MFAHVLMVFFFHFFNRSKLFDIHDYIANARTFISKSITVLHRGQSRTMLSLEAAFLLVFFFFFFVATHRRDSAVRSFIYVYPSIYYAMRDEFIEDPNHVI